MSTTSTAPDRTGAPDDDAPARRRGAAGRGPDGLTGTLVKIVLLGLVDAFAGFVLFQLAAAGDELAPGLNLLVSFPFPKAANAIVQGDYADTTAIFEVNFPNILRGLGIPNIELPGIGEVIDQVGKCLRSGSLTSRACSKVLSDLDLLRALKKDCKRAQLEDSPVCAIINAVPDLDLNSLLEGGLLGETLDGLLGGLPGLTRSLQEDRSDPKTTNASLLGGAA